MNQQNRVSLILSIADSNYMPTALLFLGLCKTETNIKGYNSEFEFEHTVFAISKQTTTSFSIGTQAKLHLPQQPGESG